jgi:hypothetical protein
MFVNILHIWLSPKLKKGGATRSTATPFLSLGETSFLAALGQLVYVIIDTIATNYQLKVLATNYLFVVQGRKYLEILQKKFYWYRDQDQL